MAGPALVYIECNSGDFGQCIAQSAHHSRPLGVFQLDNAVHFLCIWQKDNAILCTARLQTAQQLLQLTLLQMSVIIKPHIPHAYAQVSQTIERLPEVFWNAPGLTHDVLQKPVEVS